MKEEKFVGFDTLKRAVSMAQILDRYGLTEQLRRGGDSLSGACPLHQGHNPTQFRVSLSKNCWICFGDCHTGGSIIDFVSRKERVSVREAGLLIQGWFNVPVDPEPNGNGDRASSDSAERDAFVQRSNPPLGLTLGPLDGDHPYLRRRGLSPETITTFGIGYCSRGSLNGWIAIPIHNAAGKLVAYAGRVPGEPTYGSPKYRLPRGFGKSLELFNQHRAAQENPAEPLVVVEGFFGCMRLWQAGHRRVVSLMGSMLSRVQEQHIIELAGDDGQVVLMFDGDVAGRKGQAEARARLSKRVSVSAVRLPEGQQPDSPDDATVIALIQAHTRKALAA